MLFPLFTSIDFREGMLLFVVEFETNVTMYSTSPKDSLSTPVPPIDYEGGNYSDGRPSSILPQHGTRDTGQGVFQFVLVPPSGTPDHRLEAPHPRTVPALRIWHSVAPTC